MPQVPPGFHALLRRLQLVEHAQLRNWRVTLDSGAIYQLTDRDGLQATRIRRGC